MIRSAPALLYDPQDFVPVPKSAEAGRTDGFEPFFDAIYCISLKEQPERAAAAEQRLRRQGLAERLTFYRPARGTHTPRAVWTSHRAVAAHALDQGYQRILILEDDVRFRIGVRRMQSRLAASMAQLPTTWWGCYLGHLAMQMYFRGAHLVRIRAACAHAYIANTPLLHWLRESEPMDPEIRVCRWIGSSIDAAFANLPDMYSVFPLFAVQGFAGDHRIDPRRDAKGKRRFLLDPSRLRPLVLFRGMRAAEVFAVLLSPFHWLTLEAFARRSGRALSRKAAAIRRANAFDAENYLRAYPDVAASGRLPIEHYIRSGIAEGRHGGQSQSSGDGV
jgi:glycosyl transferase family 25